MCSSGWFYILFLVFPSCSATAFQAGVSPMGLGV